MPWHYRPAYQDCPSPLQGEPPERIWGIVEEYVDEKNAQAGNTGFVHPQADTLDGLHEQLLLMARDSLKYEPLDITE